MAEEIIVNEDGTVEESDNKLTTGEKVVLGTTALGIGAAGWALGNFVIVPLFKKLKSKGSESEFDRAKKEAKRRKKRSHKGVEYDEDAEFRDADDEDTED